MKIGIIIHSQTGNTLRVGEKLLERLQYEGHAVSLMRIQNLKNSEPSQKTAALQLDSFPDVSGYDAIIFGGWVEAFNLCPGFAEYLKQLTKIETQNVSCYVTQYFPYKWMGGGNAISKMNKILGNKGIQAKGLGVINWSNKKREKQIDDLVSIAAGLMANSAR